MPASRSGMPGERALSFDMPSGRIPRIASMLATYPAPRQLSRRRPPPGSAGAHRRGGRSRPQLLHVVHKHHRTPLGQPARAHGTHAPVHSCRGQRRGCRPARSSAAAPPGTQGKRYRRAMTCSRLLLGVGTSRCGHGIAIAVIVAARQGVLGVEAAQVADCIDRDIGLEAGGERSAGVVPLSHVHRSDLLPQQALDVLQHGRLVVDGDRALCGLVGGNLGEVLLTACRSRTRSCAAAIPDRSIFCRWKTRSPP